MKYFLLLLAAFAVVNAQTMADKDDDMEDTMTEEGDHHMEDPMTEPEHGMAEPEPEHGMAMCSMDSHCGMGYCHEGSCKCPKNYYGMHCETHEPLKCFTCDGFESEHSPCLTGMGLNHMTDVQVCMPNQTFCMTEIWYQDGIAWIKRHGCATHCWNRRDCKPNNRESCVACCDYDYCFGYEKEIVMMAASSDVITPSIVIIGSIASVITFLF